MLSVLERQFYLEEKWIDIVGYNVLSFEAFYLLLLSGSKEHGDCKT